MKLTDILTKLRWGKIFLVTIPPIVLAWPILPGHIPFPFQKHIELETNPSINVSELPKEIPLQGASGPIGSKSVLDSIFSVKTGTMPVELCFSNQNKIFDGEKEIPAARLIDSDEAGAMNFKFRKLNDNSNDEMYVKLGELNKCKILPSEGIALDNSGIELRNPVPLSVKAVSQKDKTVMKFEENRKLHVKLYPKPGYYHIRWVTKIFVINFTLYLIAWFYFLHFLQSLFEYIYLKDGVNTKKLSARNKQS